MMEKMYSRLVQRNFADLSGLSVDATIPITEALINEVLAAALQGNLQVENLYVHFHSENRIMVDVKFPRWPWPLRLKLKLFHAADVTPPLTVRAFLENYVLLGKLASLLEALPSGIQIYEDQVSVDIATILPLQEKEELLGLIQALEIRTGQEMIFLNIRLRR